MSREAPTNGTANGAAKETNGEAPKRRSSDGRATLCWGHLTLRPLYSLPRHLHFVPLHERAAMLAFMAPGIKATGVTHVTGSLTKAGMVLANGLLPRRPVLQFWAMRSAR